MHLGMCAHDALGALLTTVCALCITLALAVRVIGHYISYHHSANAVHIGNTGSKDGVVAFGNRHARNGLTRWDGQPKA